MVIRKSKNLLPTASTIPTLRGGRAKNLCLAAIIILFAAAPLQAQVKIGGTPGTTDASALLQIGDNTTNNKGMLLPRVSLSATDVFGLTSDTKTAGMFVYNTNTSATNPATDVTPGTYYWNGSLWVRLLDVLPAANSLANEWHTTGNDFTGGTGNEYLGTKNSQALQFRVNAGSTPINASKAGYISEVGAYNAFGLGALAINTGSNNSAFGYQALGANNTGTGNSAFGSQALSDSTGNNNTAVGNTAGSSITNGSNNILIGADVQATSATANNQLNIGSTIYGTGIYPANNGSDATPTTAKIGIGVNNPISTLETNGSSTNTKSTPADGQTIDFSKSNLAYYSGTNPAIILQGMKDGGTYTLAWQNSTAGGAATFTLTNNNTVTTKAIINNNDNNKTTLNHILYTIVCIGTTAYIAVTPTPLPTN
jgi:hypothetical protein